MSEAVKSVRRRGRYRLRSKPLLTRYEAALLRKIYDAYWAGSYDRSSYKEHVASDVLDSLVVPSEVADLVKKKILIRIQMSRCDWFWLAGEHVRCSWHLSQYGIMLMRRWRQSADRP